MSSQTFQFYPVQKQHFYTKVIDEDENIVLNIERLSPSTAIVYFTDENHNAMNIPKRLVIFEDEALHTKTILPRITNTERYILSWVNNYTIEYKGKSIIDIQCQKSWNISSLS